MNVNVEVQSSEERGRNKFEKSRIGRQLKIEWSKVDDRYDAKATAVTATDKTFVVEIKDVARDYTKYGEDAGYLIDFDKLRTMVKIAKNEGRIPLLAVFFTDCEMYWNILDTDWEKNAEWREVNAVGVDYGKNKEWEYVTYLYLKEGKRYEYDN